MVKRYYALHCKRSREDKYPRGSYNEAIPLLYAREENYVEKDGCLTFF